MKIAAVLSIGAVALGGVWLLQKSISEGHPWYWTLVEVFIIIIGIGCGYEVATGKPSEPPVEKK